MTPEDLAASMQSYFFKPDGTPRTRAERIAMVEQGIAVAAARKVLEAQPGNTNA